MIQLDLNNPEFQPNLFSLDKPEAWAVLKTLRLLQAMTWEQIQASKGLRWDLIQSRQEPFGQQLYSMRISRSCRAVAWREGAWLRFLSPHPGAFIEGVVLEPCELSIRQVASESRAEGRQNNQANGSAQQAFQQGFAAKPQPPPGL